MKTEDWVLLALLAWFLLRRPATAAGGADVTLTVTEPGDLAGQVLTWPPVQGDDSIHYSL